MVAQFHIPTKPYTIVDAINRRAAAQGSVGFAQATSFAEYNGHALGLYWNGYRGYYVGDYTWGERVVFTRSANFATALAETKREFARQGRGASCRISIGAAYTYPGDKAHDFAADVALARADADLVEGSEPTPDWQKGWKWDALQEAFLRDKFEPGVLSRLIRAETPEQFAKGA